MQVGRGFGKALDLLDPHQITRLQKVGRSKSTQQFRRNFSLSDERMKLERLRRRLALYQHPLAFETMCRLSLPASNGRAKTYAGCIGNDGNFDIVGHDLDILNFTAMSSSSPLD